jgi:hypothetical protein
MLRDCQRIGIDLGDSASAALVDDEKLRSFDRERLCRRLPAHTA